MDHLRASRTDWCNVHETRYSVTDCQYFTNSSGCYLNVRDSTPAFTYYTIIMCNYNGVSNEILVIMQAYRGTNFQLLIYDVKIC